MEETGKKSILYVITKGNWGGAQRYVFDLAVAASERGYTASVAYGAPGRLEEKLKERGVRSIPIRALQRDVSFAADIKSFWELLRLFRKERPGIVHLNSSKAGGVGALAARLAGVAQIVFTVHGLPWDENRSPLSRFAIFIVTWLTFLLSHRVIAVSKDNFERARRCLFCKNKVILIYNGVAPISFGSGEVIRKAFPPGTVITGTVGELTYNKNHVSLLERATKDPNLNLAIVGEGELRGMLEQKIRQYNLSNRVKLFGFMPAAEVLKGFDRFVLPSLKEGLGYVILEARLAGLPIEANRVGGVGEALDKDLSEFTLEQMLQKTFDCYRRG
jgi:glycosyltransferase involved in cell wall biosynthesis